MKILYATMQFGRGYGQGTERYVAMLAEGMRHRGHEVVILAGDPERRGAAQLLGDVVQDSPRVLHYPSHGWLGVRGLTSDQLAPLIEREQPDIVHIANPAHIGLGLQSAAASMRIPVVFTIMDFWWRCPKHTLLRYSGRICDGRVTWQQCLECIARSDSRTWLRALASLPLAGAVLPAMYFARSRLRGYPAGEIERWKQRQLILQEALNTADAVICPSRATRAAISSLVPADLIRSVPYGLEARWFKASPRPLRTGPFDPADLTVGYAGAFAPHKGVHLLLQALRTLGWTRTRVRLAGGGNDARYDRHLRKLAAGLPCVEFVGRVASADMPGFLTGLDLLVMPSIWPENLPIIVLEAQAAGVPVLASRIDGVTETVPAAMLFDTGSESSLAGHLQAWARDPIHQPPVQPVSTVDEMVTQTLAIYQQTTQAGPRA